MDYRISEEEKESLVALGYEILICPPLKTLYPAVSGHPDMLLHVLDKNSIVVHKDMDSSFVAILKTLHKNVLYSKNSIGSRYPLDIILNAVNLQHVFMHNIKYSDPILLEMLSKKKLVSVTQGYTKCSTAILNDNAIITSDTGIAKAMKENEIDVLFVPPGDILLPGLNYGFIGGCCGLLEDRILGFYGHLEKYAYGKEVLSFIKKHKIEPYFLSKGKLIDRGTIFTI